ncbi:MAG TPA: hypothetical protein VKN18_30500 [Blastocatellia bacterium]|nr:hypothetical protein [Blastocatellia bacterium]
MTEMITQPVDYDGPRCGDCSEYRPPEPQPPRLGIIEEEEVERNCSAFLIQLIIIIRAICGVRRRTYAARL